MDKFPNIIQSNFDKILDLCVACQVERLYLFGSVIRIDFDEKESDIDVIVEILHDDPLEKGQLLLGFWNNLEKIVGRKVDMLTDQPIRNPYFKKEVDSTKVLIYDRKNAEIFV
jgi:uncharacterized protein